MLSKPTQESDNQTACQKHNHKIIFGNATKALLLDEDG